MNFKQTERAIGHLAVILHTVYIKKKKFSKERQYRRHQSAGNTVSKGSTMGFDLKPACDSYLSQAGRLNVREPRGQQAGHQALGKSVRNPITQTKHSFLQIT